MTRFDEMWLYLLKKKLIKYVSLDSKCDLFRAVIEYGRSHRLKHE